MIPPVKSSLVLFTTFLPRQFVLRKNVYLCFGQYLGDVCETMAKWGWRWPTLTTVMARSASASPAPARTHRQNNVGCQIWAMWLKPGVRHGRDWMQGSGEELAGGLSSLVKVSYHFPAFFSSDLSNLIAVLSPESQCKVKWGKWVISFRWQKGKPILNFLGQLIQCTLAPA